MTSYKLPVPKIVETVGGIEIVIYGTPQEKKDPPDKSTQKEKQAKKLKDLKKITYKGSKKRGGYYLMENDAR